MALRYDFDIFTIMPDEVFENEQFVELLSQTGIDKNSAHNKIALFRDVKTADALRGASPKVRQLFLDSGFGLNTYDSGVPDGFYPARDQSARNYILRRFVRNVKSTSLKGEYCGDFDFSEFMDHLLLARPLPGGPERKRTPARLASKNTPPQRQSPIARIGFAIGVAVLVLVVAKLLGAVMQR